MRIKHEENPMGHVVYATSDWECGHTPTIVQHKKIMGKHCLDIACQCNREQIYLPIVGCDACGELITPETIHRTTFETITYDTRCACGVSLTTLVLK